MNNIYKVIWSKAKNCYVVASEIARSHTKSATGSEKIGGVTRRSLLASLMALSLLCGGLGVASAADSTVHVDASTTPGNATEVYTTTGVTTLLADYGKKEDVQNNKNNIANLQTTTIAQGQKITENTTNIANNKEAIDKKIDKETANATYATKDALNNLTTTVTGKADEADVNKKLAQKADLTALEAKADRTYVDQKFTEAGTSVETKLGDYYNRADVDGKITAEENARNTAINTAITQERNDRTTAIDTAINGEVAARTQAINTAIEQEKTNRDAAISTAKAELQGKITAEETERKEADTAFNNRLTTAEGKIGANETAIGELKAKDTELEGKITKNSGDITALQAKDNDLENKIQTNADNIQNNKNDIAATNKRTAGIDRIDARHETTIEGHVTVDDHGNVTADGAVNAGSLNVTGASDLKGNVTLGTPNGTNTVMVNGTANFNAAVNMDKGLNVTNGETKLQKTTVDGDLKVTGTITTDKMVFGVKPTNYTEIDQGKVTSKNSDINGAGQSITSSSTFDAEKNEVGFVNNATGDQSYHKQTSDVIMDNVKDRDNSNNRTQTKTETKDIITDENGNSSTTSQTASENKTYLTDKDRKNTNTTIDTAKGYDKTIKGENGKTSTTQDELNITNTAKDGTITNDAQNIVNTATTMKTTVTGQATESYGGLDTTVNGAENHTVNGTQTNTVTAGQINNITGGQINNITGNQTTIVTDGNISNKAEKITNEANTELTDKVGTNTRVTTSTSITDSVGATTNRKIEDGKITDTAGDFTVTTEKTKGTTFAKIGSTTAFSTEAGAPTDTNIAGNLITTGRIDANELGVSDKDEHGNTADLSVEAGKGVKASAGNGTTTGSLDVTAEEVGSSVKDASGNGSTFKQRIDAIMGNVKNNTTGEESFHKQTSDVIMDNVKDGKNSNNRTQTKTETKDIITDENGNSSTTSQTASENKTYLTDKDRKNTNSTIDTAKGYDKTIKGENGETSTQQTDSMVQSYVGKKDGSATNVTTNFANASANQVTENGQTSTVLNNKDGLLIQNTANGTSFTTADGTNTGKAQAWTNVKGNEISTGKVEANYVKMDYADVMRDLGVHGNAKIDGKTTTGSLEVTGTSTLKGDVTMESNATVNGNFNVKGDTNLKNTKVDGTLNVTQKATFDDSVSIAKDLSVTGDVTANSYKVGDKTYISAAGINANDQKITNVADGSISEGSKDAVNGGQLYNVKNDLEGKVNKVGANAAAMANLHPMEFDPDSKWNIAAAIGNYGSETAAALGAFYRPNDDVMVNLSTAFGTGENMVGGGVSVRLGKGGNKLSREESNALKAQVDDLTARMDALLSVLNPNMSKDFPDVPENHWAYEAVSRLAGNDIVQGYPDGEFHGERTMTRYEMAEIIYNALSRGAEAEKELVEEFKPELQAMAASEKATAERAEG